ncbi:OB-fold protein [Wenyingzhuangia sp. IMCC45533]
MIHKKFYIIFATLILLMSLYFIFSVNKVYRVDTRNLKTDSILKATDLTYSFIDNEIIANKKFKSKILEIEGTIKEISFKNNRHTIIIYGTANDNHVICDMKNNSNQSISSIDIHKSIKIKGLCKGFLKDVIVLNCMVIN